MFQELNNAYRTLKDDALRQTYDDELKLRTDGSRRTSKRKADAGASKGGVTKHRGDKSQKETTTASENRQEQIIFNSKSTDRVGMVLSEMSNVETLNGEKLKDSKGNSYKTLIHYFETHKDYTDANYRQAIRNCATGLEARKEGRKYERNTTWQLEWEKRQQLVMRTGIELKFKQGSECAKVLLETGEAQLILNSGVRDDIWGAEKNADGEWQVKGKNRMGKLLMFQRFNLQKAEQTGGKK